MQKKTPNVDYNHDMSFWLGIQQLQWGVKIGFMICIFNQTKLKRYLIWNQELVKVGALECSFMVKWQLQNQGFDNVKVA